MTDFLFLQRFESGVARSLPLAKVRALLGAIASQRDADGVVEFEFVPDTLADLAIAVKDAEGGVSCVAFLCPRFDQGLRALVWQCMEALGCVAFDDTLTRILIPAVAGVAASQVLPAEMTGAGATLARQVSNPCQLWPDWLDTRPDAADRYALVGRSADGSQLVQCFDQADKADQTMQIELGMLAQASNAGTLGAVHHLRLRADDAITSNPKYRIAFRYLDSETALRVMEFPATGRKTVNGVQIISPFALEVRRWPVFVSDRGNFLSLEEQAYKAVELAREQYGLQLDGTLASVRTLAHLLDQVHQARQSAAGLSAQKRSDADSEMKRWSIRAGSYLGLLVCRQVGGQVGHIRVNGWRLICVRMHTGRLHFPLLRVLDHIVNGRVDGIERWFDMVALDDASATQRSRDWVCNIPGYCFTLLGQSRLNTGGLPLDDEVPRLQLDFSLNSLRYLDSYLVRVRDQSGKLPEQTEMNLVVLAGAYLGEVVRSSAPTQWLWEPYDDYARAHPGFAERRPRQAIMMALLDSPEESAYPLANVAAILRGAPAQSCHEFAVNLVGEPAAQAGTTTPSSQNSAAVTDGGGGQAFQPDRSGQPDARRLDGASAGQAGGRLAAAQRMGTTDLNFYVHATLARFHAKQPLPEPVAFQKALGQLQFDYTPGAIERVDRLLSQIRVKLKPEPDAFIGASENRSFLHLLAFMVGETVARYRGTHCNWLNYERLQALVADRGLAANYPESFGTSVACEIAGEGLLFPLAAIAEALFEAKPRSVLAVSDAIMRRAVEAPVLTMPDMSLKVDDRLVADPAYQLGHTMGVMASWCVDSSLAHGAPQAPQLLQMNAAGKGMFISMIDRSNDDAIASGRGSLAHPEDGLVTQALGYDGYIGLPRFRSDAIVVEGAWHAKGAATAPLRAMVAMPYRPLTASQPLGLHDLRLLEFSGDADAVQKLRLGLFARLASTSPPGPWHAHYLDENSEACVASRRAAMPPLPWSYSPADWVDPAKVR